MIKDFKLFEQDDHSDLDPYNEEKWEDKIYTEEQKVYLVKMLYFLINVPLNTSFAS